MIYLPAPLSIPVATAAPSPPPLPSSSPPHPPSPPFPLILFPPPARFLPRTHVKGRDDEHKMHVKGRGGEGKFAPESLADN